MDNLKLSQTTREIEEQAKGLDMTFLDKAVSEGENMVDPDQEEENQGQSYKQSVISRNDFELDIYPTLDQVDRMF